MVFRTRQHKISVPEFLDTLICRMDSSSLSTLSIEVGEGRELLLVMLAGIGEDELETAGIVGSAGLEGVFKHLQQVDVGTGYIVDEVEVFHFNIIDFNIQCVGTVLRAQKQTGVMFFPLLHTTAYSFSLSEM